MAVMSTGSAEVIAVASLIIYDIYQVTSISGPFIFGGSDKILDVIFLFLVINISDYFYI